MRTYAAALILLVLTTGCRDKSLCPGWSVNGNCGKVPFATVDLGPSGLQAR